VGRIHADHIHARLVKAFQQGDVAFIIRDGGYNFGFFHGMSCKVLGVRETFHKGERICKVVLVISRWSMALLGLWESIDLAI